VCTPRLATGRVFLRMYEETERERTKEITRQSERMKERRESVCARERRKALLKNCCFMCWLVHIAAGLGLVLPYLYIYEHPESARAFLNTTTVVRLQSNRKTCQPHTSTAFRNSRCVSHRGSYWQRRGRSRTSRARGSCFISRV